MERIVWHFVGVILCIDKSNTIEPEYTFRPTFSPVTVKASIYGVNTSKYREQHATLPREIVCTEN